MVPTPKIDTIGSAAKLVTSSVYLVFSLIGPGVTALYILLPAVLLTHHMFTSNPVLIAIAYVTFDIVFYDVIFMWF